MLGCSVIIYLLWQPASAICITFKPTLSRVQYICFVSAAYLAPSLPCELARIWFLLGYMRSSNHSSSAVPLTNNSLIKHHLSMTALLQHDKALVKAGLHTTIGMSDGTQASTFMTCCHVSLSCVSYLGKSSAPADQPSLSWLMLGEISMTT